jgi:DNA-directed RNA polymerase specialized sigma24 family protein
MLDRKIARPLDDRSMMLAPPADRSRPHDPFAPPSELLTRIGDGDAEALGRFYDRWEAPVHAFVARLVRGPEAQERVVEAIFWQVWERAGSRGSTPVDPWMHALAVTCCRAELSQRRGQRRGAAEEPAPPLCVSAALRETNLLPH